MKKQIYVISILLCMAGCQCQKTSTDGIVPAVPSSTELNRPFGKQDEAAFRSPPKVYHPQIWYHFIEGNVATKGITDDLEAIAGAGISGVQLFHVNGGVWPGVTPQLTFLSDSWDNVMTHTAEECRRLGLRFTMHNSPGFSMSGGPWIEPSDAMRHLVWSRTDVVGGTSEIALSQPQPSEEPWRDYKDVAVLAFPTPLDDTGEPLRPQRVTSNRPEIPWMDCLRGNLKNKILLSPASADNPHWVEVTFPEVTVLRTIELSSIREFSNEAWCYAPGVTVTVEAVLPDGTWQEVLHADMPPSNWQDYSPISLACVEIQDVQTYRLSIATKDNMTFSSLRLFSAARKNNWESEAGWTLRGIVRQGANPKQSQAAFIDPLQIRDITTMMDSQGNLKWDVPSGKWTVLRIGHVNTGMRNGPAPPGGIGWECDKLSEAGPDTHFAAYIGRLTGQEAPLANGLLKGMLLDSWECRTQTWTNEMEAEFDRLSGYPLRNWLPAVFGYVVGDHETTTRFLLDWRAAFGDLFANKFYGRMAQLAKDNGLAISCETAAGDVFPADILEYFKHADVPMCEFWHPLSDNYVGSLNFKPIKPTASAARMYGKPRVAAEAFTSFNLTWDEHWDMLKEVANINAVEGVTHFVLCTYTHNPQKEFLPPGTSFGGRVGTPFLRGQTWWKYMPAFTAYLSRCTYLFERGKPVSDVLWYLGDEINHKPNQQAPFPEGFKYDYCNPDVLLNRLSVQDGMLVTPEGIRYRILWLPENPRMLPQTLEKLHALINAGATVVGDAPQGLATLSDAATAQQRFETAIRNIWGETPGRGLRQSGKGAVISGMTLAEALNELNIQPDVTGGKALWTHRSIDGADWYYVCAPQGSGFTGTLDFRNSTGTAEIWDPVTGDITAADACRNGDRTFVTLDLPQAGSCFVVFRKNAKSATTLSQHEPPNAKQIPLTAPWTLTYPEGWGAPPTLQVTALKAWKDLDVPDEAKAFSGTVTYATTFDIGEIKAGKRFSLDLGRVDMIAAVSLNGQPFRTLWTPPYRLDLTEAVLSGSNTLTVEVTGTWFNRLVYDAGQPEDQRKTWTIAGPEKEMALRESGLLGPVIITAQEKLLPAHGDEHPLALSVLVEEDVYSVPDIRNGAGVMWCYGSTPLVRNHDAVFITELAVVPTAKPLNNCYWKLLKRDAKGWNCLFSDDGNRTREPSPMVVFPNKQEVFVSANPTLVSDPEAYAGPSQPQIVRFRFGNDIVEQETLLPVWDGEPPFTEHSYRTFAADGKNHELILFQNIGYTHAEWSFYDRTGSFSSKGKISWPDGAEYIQPEPVRICYPTVALVDRKVFFCGVSDIIEPNPDWRAFKKTLTGRDWDYDFRRLFFTQTNDISKEEFQPWIEISSREETCGWITPCDLYVAPDESIHLLWAEKAIDARLREKFFPDAKQSEALCHAVIRNGKLQKRNNVMIRLENEIKPVASTGRFHATPDGRLWVVYYVSGTERNEETGTEKFISENRISEIKNDEPSLEFQTIPLEIPFSSFFTASVRAGNAPSTILDLHGICPNSHQLRYAAVRLYDERGY